MNKTKIILITLILVFITACSGKNTITRLPSEEVWQRAEDYFSRRKFSRAIPYYQRLVFERTSIHTAEAQFKLGECYFLRGGRDNFVDAIFEYQELLRLFPEHRLAPEAQFRIGQAYVRVSLSPEHDQNDSIRAIQSFTRFIERNPTDPRIEEARFYIAKMQRKAVEKVFLNGRIYFKMKDFPSSQLYLNEIIARGENDNLFRRSLFYTTLIHVDRREHEQAKDALNALRENFPDSREVKRAQRRFNKIDSKFFRIIYSL